MSRARVSVKAVIERLPEVTHFVQQCCEKTMLSERQRHDLLLATEETYVNIVQHAYPGVSGLVRVHCSSTAGGGILVEMEDEGKAFDPLQHDKPDLEQKSVDARKVGGLGILLIRRLVDDMQYERRGKTNRLSLRKDASRNSH